MVAKLGAVGACGAEGGSAEYTVLGEQGLLDVRRDAQQRHRLLDCVVVKCGAHLTALRFLFVRNAYREIIGFFRRAASLRFSFEPWVLW